MIHIRIWLMGKKVHSKDYHSNTTCKLPNIWKNVYNIIDGMEGDTVDDPGSAWKTDWKNSGSPWTYDTDPDKILLPTLQKTESS